MSATAPTAMEIACAKLPQTSADVAAPRVEVVPEPATLQHNEAVFVDAHMKRRGDWVSLCWIDTDRKTGKQGPFCSADVLKTRENLSAFVRAHPNANLYCGVNRSKARTNKRHGEADIQFFDEIVADLDPHVGESPADAKARILENEIPKLQFPPTTIKDSGNGIQITWRIKPKELNGDPVLAKHYARASRYIKQQINGDDVSDMPRVMRATGSINIPKELKLKRKDCVIAPVVILHHDDETEYEFEQFTLAAPRDEQDETATPAAPRSSRTAGNEEVPINESLVVIGPVPDFEKRVSSRGQNIRAWADNLGNLNELLKGDGRDEPPYTSNSEMGLGYISTLVRAKYTPEEIAGDVMDKPNHAGIHFRDQDNPYRAIGRAIYKAQLRIEETEAADRESPILDPYNHMERSRRFKELYRPNLRHYRGEFVDYNAGRYEGLDDDAMAEALYNFHDTARAWRQVGKKPKLEWFKPNRQTVGETRAALAAVSHLNKAIEQPCFLDGRRDPAPRDVISFSNCLLDVRTLKTFDPTPNFFTPYACGFDYNSAAAQPVAWDAFLREIFAGEHCDEQIRSLQEVIGYIISSDNSQEKAVLLYGVTRSGKDTIKNMIRALLSTGSIAGPTLDSLASDFGLSQLIGKALAIIGDARIGAKTNKDTLTENILKIVGRGFFTINRKYGSFWEGALPVKMLIVSNLLLKLIDESAAIAGRFITFRTMVSFLGKEDPDLFEKKLLPERDGVLLWALEGLRRVRQNGRIYESPVSIADRKQLARQASQSLAFIEERLEIGNFATSTKDDVFAEWQAWCAGNGLYAGSKSHFMENLRSASGGRIGDCRSTRGTTAVNRARMITGARLLPKGQEGNSDDEPENLV
jgi:putative DNA primase/helicase